MVNNVEVRALAPDKHPMYKSFIETLMHLVMWARPAPAEAIIRLESQLHEPESTHLLGAERAVRFFKETVYYEMKN